MAYPIAAAPDAATELRQAAQRLRGTKRCTEWAADCDCELVEALALAFELEAAKPIPDSELFAYARAVNKVPTNWGAS